LEKPKHSPIRFKSKFELLEGKDNFLRVSWLDFLKAAKILKPKFKQIAVLSTKDGEKIIYDHCVIALTKLKFPSLIPLCFDLRISNTAYLVKDRDGKHWIPIGYAICEAE